VVIVARILAFRTALSGFENIGTVNFQRGLRFNKTYQFTVSAKLTSFSITVISAFVLRNYWALVIGIMVEEIAAVTLSYAMEPHRPRFTLCKSATSFRFRLEPGKIDRGLSLSSSRKADDRQFRRGPRDGPHSVAYDVTTLPSEELINPVVTALFPVMVKVQRDPVKRTEIYLSVLYWSALLCVSTSVGICLVGDDMVDLGARAKWVDVKRWCRLALSFAWWRRSSNVYAALDSTGRARTSAGLQWIRLLEWRPSCCRGVLFQGSGNHRDGQVLGHFGVAHLFVYTLPETWKSASRYPDDLGGRSSRAWSWPPRWAARTSVIPFHTHRGWPSTSALGGLTFTSAMMALGSCADVPRAGSPIGGAIAASLKR